MREPAVADSTCLISLERIGRLDVLPAFYDPLLIPPEVEREFGTSLPWLPVERPADPGLIAALEMVVDRGEAEAIALAYQRQFRAILDDRQARAAARQLGLSVIGTVGILVRARRADMIPSLGQVLGELERGGFYLSTRLKQEALHLVGERPGSS